MAPTIGRAAAPPSKPKTATAARKVARLFVRNLPADFDERMLMVAATSLGVPPLTVKVVRDRATGVSRRFGFIEIETQMVAVATAIAAIDGKEVAKCVLACEESTSQTRGNSKRFLDQERRYEQQNARAKPKATKPAKRAPAPRVAAKPAVKPTVKAFGAKFKSAVEPSARPAVEPVAKRRVVPVTNVPTGVIRRPRPL